MDASSRRSAITRLLTQAQAPVSATALAARFSVSRQLIVGDIALLRAGGLEISATPRGYLLPRDSGGLRRVVACAHALKDMGRELEIIVDSGCQVLDVVVEHPVYGQLTGPLQLASRYEVQEFIRKVESCDARPLSDLTGGIHLHTLHCPDEERFQRVSALLDEAGFLYSDEHCQ